MREKCSCGGKVRFVGRYPGEDVSRVRDYYQCARCTELSWRDLPRLPDHRLPPLRVVPGGGEIIPACHMC